MQRFHPRNIRENCLRRRKRKDKGPRGRYFPPSNLKQGLNLTCTQYMQDRKLAPILASWMRGGLDILDPRRLFAGLAMSWSHLPTSRIPASSWQERNACEFCRRHTRKHRPQIRENRGTPSSYGEGLPQESERHVGCEPRNFPRPCSHTPLALRA